MPRSAVEVDHVTKRFRLYHEKPHSLKERVIKFRQNTFEEFLALKDVSLTVNEGETVGLLGHNGSGKSTLLKCMAGTLRPTQGHIRLRGRVAALLELGAGFHPELTGRENVYLNGSILGFSASDIDRIFDDIVEFAEIGPFIDNQVKHYSSGMYARLGFAVAVNVEPDILLIDEVLAVGDEQFQRKCMDRIKRFQREGRTIFVVTHAADVVRQICDRGAVLDRGTLIAYTDPAEAVRIYRDALTKKGEELPKEAIDDPRLTTKKVRFTKVTVEYADEQLYMLPGQPLVVRCGYEMSEPTDDVVFSFTMHDADGNLLISTNSMILGDDLDLSRTAGVVVFEIESVPLMGGHYFLTLGIHSRDGGTSYDHRDQLDRFEVKHTSSAIGRVQLPMRTWAEPQPSAALNRAG
jgi:ABC-2 type transport system ATP-binding protein